MKFGEKIRLLRNEKKLSQTELGRRCGLSLRTIRNYEIDGRYPKQRAVYAKLADALDCDVNYLLSEDEECMLQIKQVYIYKGICHAEELISNISAIFASSDICEEDKDAVMRALQEAYWSAKEKNKEKYVLKNCKDEIN